MNNRFSKPLAHTLRKYTIPVIVFLLLSLFFPGSALAVVTLTGFSAVPAGNHVHVEWHTATEFDNAGFYLNRSEEEHTGFVRISGFIPAEGLGLTGGDYEFDDTNVVKGTVYYYLLEAVDTNQSIQTHGPVSVAYGVPTATPTQTASAAPATNTVTPGTTPHATASHTPKPQTTGTKTSTPVPSQTKIPTATRAHTYTPSPSPSATATVPTTTPTSTATATLEPLPSIQFQMPEEQAGTSPGSSRQSPTPETSFGKDTANNNTSSRSHSRGIMAAIILLWIILAGSAYVFWFKKKTRSDE